MSNVEYGHPIICFIFATFMHVRKEFTFHSNSNGEIIQVDKID